ncbi:uncharacterized protein ISCGN_023393 [Ixodes scapularis]
MAARNLRLIFLQVVWFVAAFHDAAATTCFVSDDNAYQEQVCPAFVFWDEPSPLDMTALPALLDHHIDWQPWAFDHGRKLQKLLSHPVTSGSGADMAARNLRLIFLQVVWFVAAFHDAAATTCFVSDDNAYQEQVCPAFVFWDEPSPLDMTALPALLDHHIDWQPWAFDHGRKLQKLLSHPVTSGSGADMAARNLRLIFLQVVWFVAAFHDAAATTCFVSDDNAYQEQVCPAFVFWDEPSPLDMTALPALLDHHIDWQPWAFDHGRKLQKLLSHPVTSGSGADMAARNLRLIFLQGIRVEKMLGHCYYPEQATLYVKMLLLLKSPAGTWLTWRFWFLHRRLETLSGCAAGPSQKSLCKSRSIDNEKVNALRAKVQQLQERNKRLQKRLQRQLQMKTVAEVAGRVRVHVSPPVAALVEAQLRMSNCYSALVDANLETVAVVCDEGCQNVSLFQAT